MAFNPALLSKMQPSSLFTDPATIPSVQPQNLIPQFWVYNAGNDNIATVETNGYFVRTILDRIYKIKDCKFIQISSSDVFSDSNDFIKDFIQF